MRKEIKNNIFLFVLVIFIALSIMIKNNFTNNLIYDIENEGNYNHEDLNSSDYWVVAPIIIDDNWSVIEHPTATTSTMQLGGSSRPLMAVVENYSDSIVVFTVQEAYESIDGYNCNYYSKLRFQKQ